MDNGFATASEPHSEQATISELLDSLGSQLGCISNRLVTLTEVLFGPEVAPPVLDEERAAGMAATIEALITSARRNNEKLERLTQAF